MKVDVKSPISVAVANEIVEHVRQVKAGKARNKQLTYGQLRDRVEAAAGVKYATIGSGTYLGHVLDALVENRLPVALTTFIVPKGSSLDIEMFEEHGITRGNLVQKKREVLDFDWVDVEFVPS